MEHTPDPDQIFEGAMWLHDGVGESLVVVRWMERLHGNWETYEEHFKEELVRDGPQAHAAQPPFGDDGPGRIDDGQTGRRVSV